MVDGRQVRGQERDRGEGHRPVGQQIQNNWELAGCSRRLDPSIRSVLGEVQHLRAVGEERGAAFAEIQPARVKLCQQRDEPDRRVALAAGGDLDLRQKCLVRQMGNAELISSFPFVTSSFLTLENAPGREQRPAVLRRRIAREVRA